MSRADTIEEILGRAPNGRLRVRDIQKRLQRLEGVDDLNPSSVSAAVRQDNKFRAEAGRQVRFRIYPDDEKHGYVSLRPKGGSSHDLEKASYQVPAVIELANDRARRELKEAITAMTWQEFESNFLVQVLEGLGFRDVEITRRVRDGGKDAFCKYRRGIVESLAIVSAKHWSGGRTVPLDEVQRLRGIKGEADTAIIVTSSSFSADAQAEAAPSQNQRSVVLVDGDLIVETCFKSQVGVKEEGLPALYSFIGFDESTEGEDEP